MTWGFLVYEKENESYVDTGEETGSFEPCSQGRKGLPSLTTHRDETRGYRYSCRKRHLVVSNVT